MREIGKDLLFMIRARDKKLDQILDEGSYKIIDEANIYCTLCKDLSYPSPRRQRGALTEIALRSGNAQTVPKPAF